MTHGISPKLIAAVLGAVVSFLLTQTILDLPPAADLAINAFAVALGAYVANPGNVVPARDPDGELGEIGITEVLVIVILVLLILFIAARV